MLLTSLDKFIFVIFAYFLKQISRKCENDFLFNFRYNAKKNLLFNSGNLRITRPSPTVPTWSNWPAIHSPCQPLERMNRICWVSRATSYFLLLLLLLNYFKGTYCIASVNYYFGVSRWRVVIYDTLGYHWYKVCFAGVKTAWCHLLSQLAHSGWCVLTSSELWYFRPQLIQGLCCRCEDCLVSPAVPASTQWVACADQ